MKTKRECQHEVSAKFVFYSFILLVFLVLQIRFCSPAHGQHLNAQLVYTSEGQAGAGIGFDLPSGYGAGITHFMDATWYYGPEIFTTKEFTVLRLSKRLCPLFDINVGAGWFKSCRHIENNEWDSFTKCATYQIGGSLNAWKNIDVVCGVIFAPGNLLQIYSGAQIRIKFFD